jgi:VWFA-related protein
VAGVNRWLRYSMVRSQFGSAGVPKEECLRSSVMIASTLLLWIGPAVAQATHPTVPPTIESTTNLVLVPTLVRSPAGDLIDTLQARDFRLTDNGVEQQVTLEQLERQPLAVVVLMQTGGAASRQFGSYAKLATMLDFMMGSSAHRVALLTFDSQPEVITDFTANIDNLKDELSHPQPGDSGAAILDAMSAGIEQLKQQPVRRRRILILFSQPQDDGSSAHVEDVVRQLGENNITLYSVTFSPEKTWLKDQFTKPRHENAPYQLSPNQPLVLHTFDLGTPLGVAIKAMRSNAASTIASLSGGESVAFGGQRDLERQLSVLANHIPNRYMLSFRPTSNQAGFHALEVHVVGHPELQVAARTSYWLSTSSPH